MENLINGMSIELSEFSYENKDGGTGWTKSGYCEPYDKPAYAIVTKTWYDYETGVRGWAKPDPRDTDLIAYLERNAFKGTVKIDINEETGDVDIQQIPGDDYVIFWSQFDVTDSSK